MLPLDEPNDNPVGSVPEDIEYERLELASGSVATAVATRPELKLPITEASVPDAFDQAGTPPQSIAELLT